MAARWLVNSGRRPWVGVSEQRLRTGNVEAWVSFVINEAWYRAEQDVWRGRDGTEENEGHAR